MDLILIKTIKNLCQKYDIRPSKKLGQSFLVNESVIDKIIAAGELSEKDTVLEIGPGFGVLTQELIKYAGRVVAIEKDKRLVEYLHKNTKTQKHENNLKIINGDILKLDFTKPPLDPLLRKEGEYKIISNLPYQITSPVLWKFLAGNHFFTSPQPPPYKGEGVIKPSLMVLMVQKEVAERIVAKPGKMSILSVLCQFYAECEKVYDVGRDNFWPLPEVDSTVVRLDTRIKMRMNTNKYANKIDEKKFFQIVKIGFSAKRKMLKNNLSGGLRIPQEKVIKILKEVGLNEKVRAQELGVGEWIEVYKQVIK